jgi:hypothetical protein
MITADQIASVCECYKCGKYHFNSYDSCPFCGANMYYQDIVRGDVPKIIAASRAEQDEAIRLFERAILLADRETKQVMRSRLGDNMHTSGYFTATTYVSNPSAAYYFSTRTATT